MIRICSLVLIGTLCFASSTFAQDINRSQIQKLVKIEPAHASYLLPPQGQTNSNTAAKPAGSSHRKRNIIIAVVVAGAVAGVIVAAHNGGYGSSNNMTPGY